MAFIALPPPMSLRHRWRLWRARRSPEYRRALEQRDDLFRTVTVTIVADTTAFADACRAAARGVDQLNRSLQAVARRIAFQRELAIIRGESRWYIRGGNAGMFVAPDPDVPGQTLAQARAIDRDIHVQAMLTIRMHPRWVAAYLRGWCDSYGNDDLDPVKWHRYFDQTGTVFQVSA